MKEIKLTNSRLVALIDDNDTVLVEGFNWYANKCGDKIYAATNHHGFLIRMHVLILGLKGVDHKDGNGLNNQRNNLRQATKTQNMRNRGKTVANTSGFKGVKKNGLNWMAYIKLDGKQICLGTYRDIKEAACAYDVAALKHFGDFANLNFPSVDIVQVANKAA
jgi:hypothetical protein